MKVAGFIANRIAFNQQKTFSRFIIRLSVVATVISVMVMIVTLALANGFQEAVSQKIFSFWGHVRVQEKQPGKAIISEEIPITHNAELVRAIAQNPEVKSIHPFATRYALLKTREDIEGVLVKGIDSSFDFNNLKQFIKEGSPIRFTDTVFSRDILVSDYTASRMKLKVRDSLVIYFLKPGMETRPKKICIAGIYKTGIEEYDRLFAIGDIRLIRNLNQWNDDQVGGYEIFLRNYHKTDTVAKQLYAMDVFPETWDAISVKKISPNIFDWLSMQDVTRNVLIGFMVAVAVINLITCLLILVLERVRMIGILKSLGATNWTVQKIFLRHSLIITLTGILTGTALALILLWIQQQTGFIRLKEEAYYLSTAAVKIVGWQVALVGAGTLLISFLIMMIPSLLVRKIQPVKAIRFR
ncbi:MAG: ABC transporter permease [Sphingobacteriales bacterium]|nr:ABC transporter permease [Sphingobacteriales bacterium]